MLRDDVSDPRGEVFDLLGEVLNPPGQKLERAGGGAVRSGGAGAEPSSPAQARISFGLLRQASDSRSSGSVATRTALSWLIA
ncbi:hypothetical protein [Streptomyces sp. NPDC048269]|uniref:hypothetical protein n=1 Tax=Streptomyces sp. NPDC048269 TaxID=3155753 RepID=UPI00344069BF